MCYYSFFIGIDVSKAVLDVSCFKNGQTIYLGEYLNSKSGFKSMIKDLSKRTQSSYQEWFICFENTGCYSKELLYWLTDQGIPCLEENPLKISKSLGLRRGKDDKTDSQDISRYVFEKRDSIKPSILDKSMIIKLKSVLARRELLVKQRTALKVSLKDQKRSMDPDLYEDLEFDNQAMIKHYDKQIKGLEGKMKQLIQSDPQAAKNDKLLQSIIGIAKITSAYLIATTNNFESLTNAKKYACYAGIAPFPKSSGIKKGKKKVNQMANKKMKSLLSNGIPSIIAHDPEISIYYAKKIKQGKEPGVVTNAIKNKVIHRAFAVIRRQTPFVKMMTYA